MENFFLFVGCVLLAGLISAMIVGVIEVIISIIKTVHGSSEEDDDKYDIK